MLPTGNPDLDPNGPEAEPRDARAGKPGFEPRVLPPEGPDPAVDAASADSAAAVALTAAALGMGPLDRTKADLLEPFWDADEAVARIREIYDAAVGGMRGAFAAFAAGRRGAELDLSACRYPYAAFDIRPQDRKPADQHAHAYGHVESSGLYGTTLTRPDVFSDYYREQLASVIDTHKRPVWIGRSHAPIPLPYAVDTSTGGLASGDMEELKLSFPFPDLSRIEDRVPNGVRLARPGEQKPLALFSAQRVDFSLMRLKHYTGTSPEHFQDYVLFTNYQRYIDTFVEHGAAALEAAGSRFVRLIGPGDTLLADREGRRPGKVRECQMPAWHLVAEDGKSGLTIVNIGVGPSNAKTLTDHLAVLRPHCWLMVGHCGGLRDTQRLGDYVLAHAYVRADHVLDADLPGWVPVPPIAEVQTALAEAARTLTGLDNGDVKSILRTGTVFTTDDRDWELRHDELAVMFNQSRAVAVDMESATIAANGYRFRVPYGTLLCVSDKPLHREPKLPGVANAFYESQTSRHLLIAIEALERLRSKGAERLHSRKLRSFDEPAFR